MEALATNLPSQLTRFIGRERELAEVRALFTTSRLLTLTGAGGSGKSRLGLQVAAELVGASHFHDGVWLTELAPLTEPLLVPQVIASAVGLRHGPGSDLLQALTHFLRAKSLLLVLDNCEHLIETCASLADAVLRAAPQLKILATSREALGIAGEVNYRVPPLSFPNLGQAPSVPALLKYDAVQLLADRVMAVLPSFRVSEANSTSVAQICCRLDGIPLALELAAARAQFLSPEQIAARLNDRFELLTGGSRTALPRHQTLRAAMDWSYDLLSGSERILLRRLAVFAGSWSLEAAEAVCGGEGLNATQILDLLAQLTSKSLVIADPREGETRYRMLETIREFALEHLRGAGELAAQRRRHQEFFFQLPKSALAKAGSQEELRWLNLIEADYENFHAALGWSIESGGGEEALEALRLLWPLWFHGKPAWEGAEWYRRALAAAQTDTDTYTQALVYAADLARQVGNLDQVHHLLGRALESAQEKGDYCLLTGVLYNLGATSLFEGNFPLAIEYLEQTLALKREFCPEQMLVQTLYFLADARMRNGDLTGARVHFEEGLVLARGKRDDFLIGWGLGSLSNLGFYEGQFEEAAKLSQESLALKVKIRDEVGIAFTFETLANIASEQGQAGRASALWGAAERVREPHRAAIPPAFRAEYEVHIARARDQLGPEAFERAWAAGRTLSPAEAIDYASAETSAASGTGGPRPGPLAGPAGKRTFAGLTNREIEVAGLIGQGKSNRAIAGELVVSIKTVEAHITRILDKLGFGSRAQIAAWAVGRGLAPPPVDQETELHES